MKSKTPSYAVAGHMLDGRKMPMAAEIDFRKSVPNKELVQRQPPRRFHGLPARVVEYEAGQALSSVRKMGVIRQQPPEYMAQEMKDELATYMNRQAIHEVAAVMENEPGLMKWEPNSARDSAAFFDRKQRAKVNRQADAYFLRFSDHYQIEEKAEIVVMSRDTYETIVAALNRLLDIADECEKGRKKNG